MTDEELVEKVARGLYEAAHKGLSNCYDWEDHWEEYQEVHRPTYYKQARAIIPIVREADKARIAELSDALDCIADIETDWTAGIDENLERVRTIADLALRNKQ